MTLRVYSPGDPVEHRTASGRWERATYVRTGRGDHHLSDRAGLPLVVDSRHLRHPKTRKAPSRPERPRRPTTGAHAARSHSLEAPEGVRQEKPSGPWRSEAYLDYVRSQPCCVCGDRGRSHAHHEAGPGERGTGTKASDALTVPVCPGDHMRIHAHGTPCETWNAEGWRDFARATQARLWRAWIERGSR